MKKVGEQKRHTDVPAFAENVGVLTLIETRECLPGNITYDSIFRSITESDTQEYFSCLRVKIGLWYYRCYLFYGNSW